MRLFIHSQHLRYVYIRIDDERAYPELDLCVSRTINIEIAVWLVSKTLLCAGAIVSLKDDIIIYLKNRNVKIGIRAAVHCYLFPFTDTQIEGIFCT